MVKKEASRRICKDVGFVPQSKDRFHWSAVSITKAYHATNLALGSRVVHFPKGKAKHTAVC